MGLICVLAFSVSLDSMSIGMAYAMRGVSIPWSTKGLIGSINMILTSVALFAGHRLEQWIPVQWFQLVGGGILIIIGIRTLWNAITEHHAVNYDRDDSCSLEPGEGLILAVSLALDSMCAGFGIRNTGPAVYTFAVLTGVISVVLLSAGTIFCGKMCPNLKKLNGLAGCVLIFAGIFRTVSGWL